MERITATDLTRDDWLALRAKYVSSTESAALYGMSPYLTEFELWHRKKAGDIGEIEDTFRMKAGRMLEDVIAQMAADELGLTVEPLKDYMYIPEASIGSSFDYRTTDGTALIECKNVDRIIYHQQWSDDSAPDHIEVQVQHQMEVADIDTCYIAALVGGNELKIIERKRNPRVGAAIIRKVQKFWASIEAGTEPEPNWERDAEFVIELNRDGSGEQVEADPEVDALVREYSALKSAAKSAEDEAKVLKAKVLELVGDASAIVGEDYKVSTSTTKDTPAKMLTVTEDMVGSEIQLSGPRKGYRQFRINMKKGA